MLRKQARRLENDIDVKLVAFSKVGSNSVPTTSADTAPLLGEHVFDSLSMEIEQMLEKVAATPTLEVHPDLFTIDSPTALGGQ